MLNGTEKEDAVAAAEAERRQKEEEEKERRLKIEKLREQQLEETRKLQVCKPNPL